MSGISSGIAPDRIQRSTVGLLKVLARRAPRAAKAYHRVCDEVRILFYALRSGLWEQTQRRNQNRSNRQKQWPLVWESPLPLESCPNHWITALRRLDIQCSEGGHAIYIPPQSGLPAKLGNFVAAYPADAGYKILKNAGSPEQARYLGDLSHVTWIHSALVGTAQDMVPVAGLLHGLKITPRLYDVAQLTVGSLVLTMFVVQHIDGSCPTEAEARDFIGKIQHLVEAKRIALALPHWQREPDFQCPGCSGNLLKSKSDGGLYYVDFQDFLIPDYDRYLRTLCDQAKVDVHFGQTAVVRGGHYLYQRIPGVSGPAKRDTRRRWETIEALLAQQGIGVSGRVVLDVGCNTGMILAEALNHGALWGVGWDRPEVIAHTERLLSAIGYTRRQLIGVELSKEYRMLPDIPSHLHPFLGNSVLFYLAMREHIGFIDALATIPWRVLVYEGHEGEAHADWSEVTGELQRLTPCDLVATAEIRDGDSGARPLAVFLRRAR